MRDSWNLLAVATITAFLMSVLLTTSGHPIKTNDDVAGIAVDEYNKNVPEEISAHLIGGDIYIPDSDKEISRIPGGSQGAPLGIWENRRWKEGVVPYILDLEYDTREKNLIRAGLRDIERVAPCISFHEYTAGQQGLPTEHIIVIKNKGCWSIIGRSGTGRAQNLALAHYCITEDKGTIKHEFLHALGFYHEQTRPDRDQYVNVYYDRMSDGAEYNFRITERTSDLGVPYDRISIMHYRGSAWRKSGEERNTMEWKADPSLPLGNKKLSEKDILQLNRLYCDKGYTTPKPITTSRSTTSTTTTETPTTKTTTTTPIPTSTTTTTAPTTTLTTTTTSPTTTSTTTTTIPTTTSTTTTTAPTTTSTTTTTTPTTTTTTPTTKTAAPTTTTATTTSPTTATTPTTTETPTTTTESFTQTTTTTTTTTTAPKIKTTANPSKNVCGDYLGICIRASSRYCSYSAEIREICPRSCKICTGSSNEMCLNMKNKWSDSYCEKLAKQGRCQHQSWSTRYSMKTNCGKQCCQRNELYHYQG